MGYSKTIKQGLLSFSVSRISQWSLNYALAQLSNLIQAREILN